MRLATVATCSLNQFAMDFKGNLERIIQSIREAKRLGARYRIGSELEVSGYSCEDHFLEIDTYTHSMEVLAEILKTDLTDNILVDLGMPVLHKNVRYNTRVILCNRKIILIKPKMYLANDGNYREMRFFVGWTKRFHTEEFTLPKIIEKITGQRYCPIGDAVVQALDTTVGSETCEELFVPKSPHISMGLDGVEIIGNGSGSHHTLRKLHKRVQLILGSSAKSGGCYIYSNQQGCDGNRLYFDGSSMISLNGEMIAQGSQFSVKDVEVVTATIDLEEIRAYRLVQQARSVQSSFQKEYPRVKVEFELCRREFCRSLAPSPRIEVKYLEPEAEIAMGPACWLWDYLRRSGTSGFFLPLSGGADSSSTAAIVGSMCQLVYREAVENGNTLVLSDLRRACGMTNEDWLPTSHQDIASRLFHTCYMGTVNSSKETRNRAKKLASEIGAYHLDVNIDIVVSAMTTLMTTITGRTPKYQSQGGSYCEDIALQNIQARLRMVLSYFLAQTLNWIRGGSGRSLLVLGSANVGEALRGYYTKYDCSSADINPIGGISKNDLKRFLWWGASSLGYPTLKEIVEAPPTAELRPLDEQSAIVQTDEADMGMTYDDLSLYGKMRKVDGNGPVSMFKRLTFIYGHLSVREVADKVKHFFKYYAINRHKMTTLTPSYHCENYSPDDNRFDLRQFLYNVQWPWQFEKIDELVKEYEESGKFETDRTHE